MNIHVCDYAMMAVLLSGLRSVPTRQHKTKQRHEELMRCLRSNMKTVGTRFDGINGTIAANAVFSDVIDISHKHTGKPTIPVLKATVEALVSDMVFYSKRRYNAIKHIEDARKKANKNADTPARASYKMWQRIENRFWDAHKHSDIVITEADYDLACKIADEISEYIFGVV